MLERETLLLQHADISRIFCDAISLQNLSDVAKSSLYLMFSNEIKPNFERSTQKIGMDIDVKYTL